MSTSDPFLPLQGDDAVRHDSPVEPQDHDAEDESEPDVFPGSAGDGEDSADEPPVSEHSVFRTPSGQRVDPADDVV